MTLYPKLIARGNMLASALPPQSALVSRWGKLVEQSAKNTLTSDEKAEAYALLDTMARIRRTYNK
jgi:hypothetical protein